MMFRDFALGQSFWTLSGEWICTDIGTRVIVGIEAKRDDPLWNQGPPYAMAETVFDEDDQTVCFTSEAEMLADMGPGRSASDSLTDRAE
jgi:hypothetical protein